MKNWLQTAFLRPPKAKHANSGTPLIALQLQSRARWTMQNYSALAREGYQNNAIGYRCVRLISETAASVSLCLEQNNKCGGDNIRALLANPNPNNTRREFFENFYGFLQLSGESFIEAVEMDGRPIAMFNLRPDRMRALTDKSGRQIGWEYEVNGHKRKFNTYMSEKPSIFHSRLFHPTNDINGFSPLQAASRAVDIHNSGSVWAKSLLDNSARPSGALVYKGTNGAENLTDEQFARLKSELETRHSGASAAGRPLLLEGGLDWKTMSLSPTDMDFINARREAAREIALAFGVPPMLLGIPGDNTYSNYKEANLAFWRQTILPLVRKTADGLSVWLSKWFEEEIVLHVDESSIPALAVEMSARLQALNMCEFMSKDEKRKFAGLPISGASQ